MGHEVDLLAVCVGNTRARLGVFLKGELVEQRVVSAREAASAARELLAEREMPCVVASVNKDAGEAVAAGAEVIRVGPDLPVPIALALDDPATVGQDRLVCALAAWKRSGQAVIVIDAGTAITVDFVDGEGTFQGGLIAPGVAMMLGALHTGTSALPAVEWHRPDPARGVWGKDTRHAMTLGVRTAAVGLVRLAIEEFALAYEAYPRVIATGGDAPALFEDDPIVERIVPELQLLGVRDAYAMAVAGEGL